MSSYYSPKEFVGFIGAETTVGTEGGTLNAIQSDSLANITYNEAKTLEKRANSIGRLLTSGDLESHEPGAVHEFSSSGILTKTLADILLPNVLGVALGSSPDTIVIPKEYNPDAYDYASSGGAHTSLSCGIAGPTSLAAASDLVLTGCVTDSLTLSANANEMGGRFSFDMTAKTRTKASSTMASKTIQDYTNDYLYLSDCTVSKLNGVDTIIDSFSLTIENPISFQGNKVVSTDKGLAEKYLRAVPSLKITGSMTVKYDDDTEEFIAGARNLTEYSGAAKSFLNLSNDDTGAGETPFDATSGFGFHIPNGIITEATRDESDYMRLNLSFEAVDKGGDFDFFEFLRGN